MKEIIKLIEKEIKYCEKHRGESGESEYWETGFVAGLEQAIFLAKRLNNTIEFKEKLEASE